MTIASLWCVSVSESEWAEEEKFKEMLSIAVFLGGDGSDNDDNGQVCIGLHCKHCRAAWLFTIGPGTWSNYLIKWGIAWTTQPRTPYPARHALIRGLMDTEDYQGVMLNASCQLSSSCLKAHRFVHRHTSCLQGCLIGENVTSAS